MPASRKRRRNGAALIIRRRPAIRSRAASAHSAAVRTGGR